jgi:malate/lactate dehydrogenase
MIYYRINGKIVLSKIPRDSYTIVSEEEAKEEKGLIYALTNMPPQKSRRSFTVTHPSMLFLEKESLELLKNNYDIDSNIPKWLMDKISAHEVTCINATYPHWEKVLENRLPDKWRINIIGLGDVGGNLAAGLRLSAGDYVTSVGIYDIDKNRIKRWMYEAAQTLSPNEDYKHPEIYALNETELFDCDMFVFCVSVGVPEVGKEPEDVRIAQFEGNARVLAEYSLQARRENFPGLFIVMSDPVDLLCNISFNYTNKDEEGNMDYRGLAPEQIRGYGLGVMHGRAAYFAKENNANYYLNEGRCFGPHGEGVVVADSIKNYKEELSDYLTTRTKNANLDVRTFGFKPYIAPAFSSGVLSFIETFRGNWNYSATFIGGVFMGSRNKLLPSGTVLETYDFPDNLYSKLQNTYDYLSDWYKRPIFHDVNKKISD